MKYLTQIQWIEFQGCISLQQYQKHISFTRAVVDDKMNHLSFED